MKARLSQTAKKIQYICQRILFLISLSDGGCNNSSDYKVRTNNEKHEKLILLLLFSITPEKKESLF